MIDIKTHLKDIPGELYERPWKNFGDSRSEAYDLVKGKGDYILFMDADDTLVYDDNFEMTNLTCDAYNMWRGVPGFSYLKPQLVRGDLNWRWVGVTHEYLTCDQYYSSELLPHVRYVSGDGGARSKGIGKFLENIRLLEDDLEKDPHNSRSMFYLAESYRDAGKKGPAMEWFQKRVNAGGWTEEVYWSMLNIGHLMRDIGFSKGIVTKSYEEAHAFRPHRSEAPYYLAQYYMDKHDFQKAYDTIVAAQAVEKPSQKDVLFNEDWIDDYGFLFQKSICAYYVGHYNESIELCQKLLTLENLPEAWKEQTKTNMTYPLAKLAQPQVNERGFWQGAVTEEDHSFDAPLAEALVQFFKKEKAKSIVDFGCGVGDYVKTLVKSKFNCKGYDGNPNTRELSGGVAEVLDLSKPADLKRSFDWVLSLEVGEHLPKEFEKTFIENLHKHNTKGVVLSWAVKGQGGFGHFNEQNNDYIKETMAKYGYINDVDAEQKLRDASTLWWFKNTIMVFRKKHKNV